MLWCVHTLLTLYIYATDSRNSLAVQSSHLSDYVSAVYAGGADSAVLSTDCVRSGRQRSRLLCRRRQRSHEKSTQSTHTQPCLIRPNPLSVHAAL